MNFQKIFKEGSNNTSLLFLIGAAIMIISHGIHVVDPNYHLFFQVSFIIGYIIFMFEPLFRGEKIDIYKFSYKGLIVLLVIIGIILDNIYVERVYHNKEEDKTD
tara:strand:+ start:194 stop:505 length:312 start_codon:yes stop_codon:yes gene_type:complete